MDTEGRRRSDNFEDRGAGGGRFGGGGAAPALLFGLVRTLGVKGTLVIVALVGGFYLFAPASLKQAIFGGGGDPGGSGSAASTCAASPAFGRACDFSRVVLASTEDVWSAEFRKGALPDYGRSVSTYRNPTLVVFSHGVETGCGNATSAIGPFYCPSDGRLYLDPSFYDTMTRRLRAPGDFAQAYVIAHEVGHHVQNLRGLLGGGEVSSIAKELQADCLAGAWGKDAQRRSLLEVGDVDEALNAAAQIGDDTLQRKTQGRVQPETWTHGSAAQRSSSFKKGLEGGVGACGV